MNQEIKPQPLSKEQFDKYIATKTTWGGTADRGYVKYETPTGEVISLPLGRKKQREPFLRGGE